MSQNSGDLYRAADYIADFLVAIGVEDVFLLPGGGAMHLVDAVGKQSAINVIACQHEQAASIAAEAYGRIHSSGIGVAIVTSGPGATNAITAVAGAWIESIPMVIISGQVKRSDMLSGAPLRQKGVQEVDVIDIVKGITKYAKVLDDIDQLPNELVRAIQIAKDGRAGPVWLDVPLDVQGAPFSSKPPEKLNVHPKSDNAVSRDMLAQITSMLNQAERPLLLAGHGVRLSGASDKFRQLAERLGVPVVTTWNALDLLPYEHPLYVGRPGVVALRAPNFAVQNCDLLISIGSRLDNIITAYNPRGFARAARKIIADVDTHEIEKLDMDIDIKVVADAETFIDALLSTDIAIASQNVGEWRERCVSWKARYKVNDGRPFVDQPDASHYQFVDALSDAIPENTLVSTGSSGLAVEAFYTVFRNKPGQRVFLTSGLGAMGYGLPAAIGSCVGNGRKPMVAVESDGSLQLNIQELATMRSNDLPICLVVMNNNGYCSIRNTQKNYFKGRYVGTGPEAGMMFPSLEKIAAAYEIPYVEVKDPKLLSKLVPEALNSKGPMIIDMQLVSNEVLSPKVAALPQPDGSMLSMPLEDMSPLLPLEELKREMMIPLLPQSEKARH